MTETIAPHAAEPRDESPRKRRRWPWVVAIVTVLLLAPVLAWLEADRRANALIEAEVQSCRDAGEPIDLEDFDSKPAPEDQDAARRLRDAATALTLTDEQEALISDLDPAAIAAKPQEFRAILEANSRPLAMVRSARSMTGADWGVRMRSPAFTAMVPLLAPQRELARLLCCEALIRHQAGDDAAAVEAIRDVLTIARTVEKSPFIISHLVAIASQAIGVQAVETVAKDLKVSPSGASSPGGHASSRQIRALIGELLDDDPARQCARRAYQTERAWMADMVRCLSRGQISWWKELVSHQSLPARAEVLVLRPWIKSEIAFGLRQLGSRASAMLEADLPAARRAVLDRGPLSGLAGRAARWSNVLVASLGRAAVLHFRCLAARRMAATALAIRLYEIDHGRRPEGLADLVPEYLPAVPDDPMDAGRKISYLPRAKRPLLYSVGENGADDGGAYAANPDDPPEWDSYDQPFFLNADRPRKPPEPAPATAPGEHSPEAPPQTQAVPGPEDPPSPAPPQ